MKTAHIIFHILVIIDVCYLFPICSDEIKNLFWWTKNN